MVDAIRENRPPVLTGEDRRVSLAINMAIYQSSQKGGLEVSVSQQVGVPSSAEMATILTEADVVSVLSMPEPIRLVEGRLLSSRPAAQSWPRVALKLTGEAGAFRIMAASVPDMGVFGLKTLTGVPGQRRIGLTYFAMRLFDSDTGALSAMIPATRITSVRTGAAGAVAVKHLARPDARVSGCSAQAYRPERKSTLFSPCVNSSSSRSWTSISSAPDRSRRRYGPTASLPLWLAMRPSTWLIAISSSRPLRRQPGRAGSVAPAGRARKCYWRESPTKRELDVAAMQRAIC